jgi:hypothetical protein
MRDWLGRESHTLKRGHAGTNKYFTTEGKGHRGISGNSIVSSIFLRNVLPTNNLKSLCLCGKKLPGPVVRTFEMLQTLILETAK